MRNNRRRRPAWQVAGPTVVGFVTLLWVIEVVDVALGNDLDRWGVRPRSDEGLVGVVLAPLLHGGWGHLSANTVPVLVLGFLTLATGLVRGLLATGVIWVVAGLGTWLVAGEHSVHLGASGLVFGWIVYLAVRGVVNRRFGQIVLGVLVLVLYGGVLLGVLPGQPGVSWQGHLFGAVGGAVASVALSDRRRRTLPVL